VAILGLYGAALHFGLGENESRALAFTALIAGALVLALANSAEPGSDLLARGRKAFWIIGAVAALVMGVVLYVPAVANLFRLSAPPAWALGAALVLMLLAAGWPRLRRREATPSATASPIR
ncbi:MAG TPA: cation transporting ATPase C-terminal domain-containing protein, partial [Steroidobacteraceae bacterium]|nr:cation transporting ATPase C-terminal domain-containing protein [Steroidobacteraceae bacterium]